MPSEWSGTPLSETAGRKCIGSDYRWYHMNYGWGNDGLDSWYPLDALYLDDPPNEYMLVNIYPAPALHGYLHGSYPGGPGTFRYFNADAFGHRFRQWWRGVHDTLDSSFRTPSVSAGPRSLRPLRGLARRLPASPWRALRVLSWQAARLPAPRPLGTPSAPSCHYRNPSEG